MQGFGGLCLMVCKKSLVTPNAKPSSQPVFLFWSSDSCDRHCVCCRSPTKAAIRISKTKPSSEIFRRHKTVRRVGCMQTLNVALICAPPAHHLPQLRHPEATSSYYTVATSSTFFLAPCCLDTVPGRPPFSQRSYARQLQDRMQIKTSETRRIAVKQQITNYV